MQDTTPAHNLVCELCVVSVHMLLPTLPIFSQNVFLHLFVKFFKHCIHTYEDKAFPQVPVEVPVDNCNNGNLGFRNASQQFCTVSSVTPETTELFCLSLNGLSLKNTTPAVSTKQYMLTCTVKDYGCGFITTII